MDDGPAEGDGPSRSEYFRLIAGAEVDCGNVLAVVLLSASPQRSSRFPFPFFPLLSSTLASEVVTELCSKRLLS